MFKTMDNVAVYDKPDIDASLGIKPANKGTAFEEIGSLDTRVARLEHTAVTKSEVTSLVSETVDSIIDEKIAEIKPELEAEIDAIIDSKITAATTPMTTAEVTAVIDQYF